MLDWCPFWSLGWCRVSFHVACGLAADTWANVATAFRRSPSSWTAFYRFRKALYFDSYAVYSCFSDWVLQPCQPQGSVALTLNTIVVKASESHSRPASGVRVTHLQRVSNSAYFCAVAAQSISSVCFRLAWGFYLLLSTVRSCSIAGLSCWDQDWLGRLPQDYHCIVKSSTNYRPPYTCSLEVQMVSCTVASLAAILSCYCRLRLAGYCCYSSWEGSMATAGDDDAAVATSILLLLQAMLVPFGGRCQPDSSRKLEYCCCWCRNIGRNCLTPVAGYYSAIVVGTAAAAVAVATRVGFSGQ